MVIYIVFPNVVRIPNTWVESPAFGLMLDKQYVPWTNRNDDLTSFQSPRNTDNEAEPFQAMLQDLWIKIKRNLSGLPYQRHILLSPGESQDRTIFDDYLSIQHRYIFWKFFFNVTQLMVDRRCTNLALMGDCLQLACEICYNDVLSRNLMQRLQQSYLPKKFRHTTNFEQLMHLPYEIAHKKVLSRHEEIKRAATAGNVGLVYILLKFGITVLRPRVDGVDDPEEYNYTKHVMTQIFNKYLTLTFITRNLNEIPPVSRRRVFLLMRILNIIPKIRVQREHEREYVQCMKLVFDSIPDPLFTVSEVEKSLRKICRRYVTQEEISGLCDEFKSYFPESDKPLGPRNLQHLCRVKVRESLRSHKGCFQAGVKYLLITNSLKSFILLKDGETSDLKPIMSTRGIKNETIISNFLYYVLEDRL